MPSKLLSKIPTPEQARELQDRYGAVADGLANMVTGLNVEGHDKRVSTKLVPIQRMSPQKLDSFFNEDIFNIICSKPAEDMTREWFALSGFTNAPKVMEWLDRSRVKSKITEAITWSRVYGGSLLVVYTDDTASGLESELKLREVNEITGFEVVDRFAVEVVEWYDSEEDARTHKFGMPKVYRIRPPRPHSQGRAVYEIDVHESRCIRFDGPLTPARDRALCDGWNRGIVERIFATARDFSTAFESAAHLSTDIAQAVFQIENLGELFASGLGQHVADRIMQMDRLRSSSRAVVLDTTESFGRAATPLHGFPELLDRFAMRLSAAAGIPVTLLMGRSPAGQNSTGEADFRAYYDRIAAQQENLLKPALDSLVELIVHARKGPTRGRVPTNWEIKFNPLYRNSMKEEVEARRQLAAADNAYIQAGVLSAAEVAESRFGSGRFSMDTQLDPTLDREAELQASFSSLGSESNFSNDPKEEGRERGDTASLKEEEA